MAFEKTEVSLRSLLLLLIIPFILIAPQWSCCCLSEISPAVKSIAEGKSCCAKASTPTPKGSHHCKCDKISKTNEVEKVKNFDVSKKLDLDKEFVYQIQPSFLVGLKSLQNIKATPCFVVNIRKDPPRSYYLQYCSLLI